MASEPKWTSGPWRTANKHPRHICNENGFKIAKCLLETKGCHGLSISVEEAEANARLISAAPELYEALQQHEAFLERLIAMVSGGSDITDVDFADAMNGVLALSDAALSKARGES